MPFILRDRRHFFHGNSGVGREGISEGFDAFDSIRLLEPEDFKLAHEKNKEVRRLSAKFAAEQKSLRMFELNKRSLLFDAPYDFDAAIRYAEWDREPKKKFYMPRRKQLLPVVQAMQRLSERKIRILGVMAPPGVGKTTIELMFSTARCKRCIP